MPDERNHTPSSLALKRSDDVSAQRFFRRPDRKQRILGANVSAGGASFNSLDAQREACEAYIKSQAHEGWRLIPDRFDDGGLSDALLDRPALQDLLEQVRARKIDRVSECADQDLPRLLPEANRLARGKAFTALRARA
jgi:Resolvase, N terminal domain